MPEDMAYCLASQLTTRSRQIKMAGISLLCALCSIKKIKIMSLDQLFFALIWRSYIYFIKEGTTSSMVQIVQQKENFAICPAQILWCYKHL
jgi:hypothetical protein